MSKICGEKLRQISPRILPQYDCPDAIEPFTKKNVMNFFGLENASKRKEFFDLKNRQKENIRIYSRNKLFKNKIPVRKYYLSFMLLILLDIVGQIQLNRPFSVKSNYSYVKIKVKGTGYRSVFYNNTEKFFASYYPEEIYINGKKQDIINSSYYFNRTYNYVKLVWNNDIDNPGYMFVGCTDIIEADLSNLDTSRATNMSYIFTDCISITSLNLNNIDTSNTVLMYDTFRNCTSLTSLNLSSFDTSNVENMQNLFADCISLSSFDLSNFNTAKVTVFGYMFKNCINLEYLNFKNFVCDSSIWRLELLKNVSQNIVICADNDREQMESYETRLSDSECYVLTDCSSDWKSLQKMLNTKDNACVDSCNLNTDFNKEYNFKCYDNCQSGILINDDSNSEISECKCQLDQCLKCPPVPLLKGLCTKCNVDYYPIEKDPENIGEYINCYKDPEGYYLDINAELYKRCHYTCKTCEMKGNYLFHNCKLCNSKFPIEINFNDSNNYINCYKECNYYYFECQNNYHCMINSSFPNEYPIEIKEAIFHKKIICFEELPENYYLDNNDNIYKECYNTCITCTKSGNETINNCDECINNYIFLNESCVPPKNCYIDCIFYFYFNEMNQYVCTESNICPPAYNLLIEQKQKCIDECKKDDEYSFNYNNSCIKECPENTKIDVDEKKCLDECLPNQIELGNECYNNFPNNYHQILNNKNNIFMDNNENFQDKLYNILQQVYSPENGNSLTIQRNDDIIFQITDSKTELELLKNKSNNIQNISIIDLGECETKLREAYHIKENDSLIFIKNEKKSDKAFNKKVDFDVYEPYNKTKLNLSICDGTPINIIIPVELSEETKELYEKMKESGYDMFDINDPFYQDICTPFDSDDGTDMLLSDRVNFIYNNDDTRCQSNCELSFYSLESQYLNCSCSANEDASDENMEKIEKFTAKKLYESFYEVLKYSNYDIIKCANAIKNKNIILKNIGSIIIIIYFTIYLVCLIIYIIKGINPLKTKLKNNIEKSNDKNDLKLKKNLLFLFFPPHKYKRSIKNISKKKSIIIYPNNAELVNNKKITNRRKLETLVIKHRTNTNDKFLINSRQSSSKNDLNFFPGVKEKNFSMKKNILRFNTDIRQEEKKDYDDYELNELEYKEAVKYDKRSLLQIYWAILKREHLIIFTFINCQDYNLLFYFFRMNQCINYF